MAAVSGFDFSPLKMIDDTDELDSRIMNLLLETRETHLPEKVITLRPTDKAFITNEMKTIDRMREKEYARRGKSVRFHLLKNKFDTLFAKASKVFLTKNVDMLVMTKPGKAHRVLRKMGARPGEDLDSTEYVLPQFKDQGLTNREIANQIGDFFAKMS